MAQLLVATHTHRIVAVRPDSHRWGRRESKAVWLAAGGLESEWPAEYLVLLAPGLPVAAAPAVGRHFDVHLLTPEQRSALDASGQVTLEPWQFYLMER